MRIHGFLYQRHTYKNDIINLNNKHDDYSSQISANTYFYQEWLLHENINVKNIREKEKILLKSYITIIFSTKHNIHKLGNYTLIQT